jgi:CO/xanthine dehydrogenase Mo-binding subunit
LAKSGVGASAKRKEDERCLYGRGQYISDLRFPRMRDVAIVRSPIAHARLKAVIIPGHLRSSVFTALDLAGALPIKAVSPLPGFHASEQLVLVTDKIRKVGELIAIRVADTRGEAEDIAAQVSLDYEELPAVVDMLEAQKPGSALVHDGVKGNVDVNVRYDGDIESVAKTAPVKVTRELHTARQVMSPIECRGFIAQWDTRLRQLILHGATQFPHVVRSGLAQVLQIPELQIRVVSPDVGGGFGYKAILAGEEVCLSWLAMQRHIAARAKHSIVAHGDGLDVGLQQRGTYARYPLGQLVAGARGSTGGPDHAARTPGPARIRRWRRSAANVSVSTLTTSRSSLATPNYRDIARAYYLAPNELPGDTDPHGLEVTSGFSPTCLTGTHTEAAHAAVLAVDPETGGVEILDYVVVEDAGTLVNPMIVDGQIIGTTQGIGSALFEEMPFDRHGQPLASTLADYLLPGSAEVPSIRVLHMETPSPYTEFGIKGVGEGGAIAPGGAIANAINDALKQFGVEICEIPITPRRILRALSAHARA